MKIKFTADTNPELQGGDFKKGATLECSPASAHHWIRRGVAVEVVDKPAPTLKVGRPMMSESRVLKPAFSQQRLDGSHQEREDAESVDKP